MTPWLATWDACSAAERECGAWWYPTAGDVVATMAQDFGLSRLHAAGVVSALSPRMPWVRNVAAARSILSGDGRVWHTRQQERIARAIAAGGDPLAILRGPKTLAFALALSGLTTAVVLDTHMLCIMGMPPGSQLTGRAYRSAASSLSAAARKVGVAPRDFQATLWVHQRGSAA